MRPLLAIALLLAASLAGCTIDDTRPADGDDGFAPGGIEVTADAAVEGETYNLSAVAMNQGTQAVGYRDGCQHEWEWEILDADETAVEHGHQVVCLGFQEAELGPGESDRFAFLWNGTERDGTTGSFEPVEPGTYTFRIAFLFGDGERSQGDVQFDVA